MDKNWKYEYLGRWQTRLIKKMELKVRKYKKVALIILVTIFFACKSSINNVKIVKEYYPSGNIHVIYKLLNNSIHIDTAYTYFENGRLQTKMFYDSTGKLSGMQEDYDSITGIISSKSNYINGIAQGDIFFMIP